MDLEMAQRTFEDLDRRGAGFDEWKDLRDALTRTLLVMHGELVTAQRALLRRELQDAATVAELGTEIQSLRRIKIDVDARLATLRAR